MNDVKANEKPKILGIISLVLGIVAFIIGWIPFVNFFGFACGVAAIVLGAIELTNISRGKSSPDVKGMAIAGIILGAVSIVFGIAMGVVFGILLRTFGIWGRMGGWRCW